MDEPQAYATQSHIFPDSLTAAVAANFIWFGVKRGPRTTSVGAGSREKELERCRPGKILTESAQIEAGFRKYFQRDVDHKKKLKSEAGDDKAPAGTDGQTSSSPPEKAEKPLEHEYTIIVCHMNVIRCPHPSPDPNPPSVRRCAGRQ